MQDDHILRPRVRAAQHDPQRIQLLTTCQSLRLRHHFPLCPYRGIGERLQTYATLPVLLVESMGKPIRDVVQVLVRQPPLVRPSLLKPQGILTIVSLAAWALAFQVIQHAGRLIDDTPTLLTNFETQIDVLETIAVAFIESAYGLEHVAPDPPLGLLRLRVAVERVPARDRAGLPRLEPCLRACFVAHPLLLRPLAAAVGGRPAPPRSYDSALPVRVLAPR